MKLVALDKSNWEEAAKLEVREDQKSFVASNLKTIAETQFYPWAYRMCAYDGETMVGFMAFGKDPDEGKYWLFRFMIGEQHQGKGFGRASLNALIDFLKALPDCAGVTVGYQPDNQVAERLYLSVGFVKGDPAPWGESTARIVFERTSDGKQQTAIS